MAAEVRHSWAHTFDLEPMLGSSLLVDCRPLVPVVDDVLVVESVVLYRMETVQKLVNLSAKENGESEKVDTNLVETMADMEH